MRLTESELNPNAVWYVVTRSLQSRCSSKLKSRWRAFNVARNGKTRSGERASRSVTNQGAGRVYCCPEFRIWPIESAVGSLPVVPQNIMTGEYESRNINGESGGDANALIGQGLTEIMIQA